MPILRRAPDNTLAETLGRFASSFGNPQSWAEAQLLQRRILMQDLEYQQKQKAIQAQTAADTAMRRVPGMTPDIAAEVSNMIYNNPTDPEKAYKWALIRTHHWDTSGTPEGDRKNVEMYTTIYGTHPTGTVFTGSNLPQIQREQAQGEELKSRGQAYGTAQGTQKATEEYGRAHPMLDIPGDATAWAYDVQNYRNTHKGEEPPAGWTPGLRTQQFLEQHKIAADAYAEAMKKQAELGQTGIPIPAGGAVFSRNPPSTTYPPLVTSDAGQPVQPPATQGGPQPPTTQAGGGGPQPPATQAPPGNVSVSQPGTAGYAQPSPIITNIPGTDKYILGAPAGQGKAAEERTAQDNATLQKAIDGWQAASSIHDKLMQAKELADFINSGSGVGQLGLKLLQGLNASGFVVNDKASAMSALDTILKQQLPDMVKEYNAKFAGPEIKAFDPVIGNATLPRQVLLNNIARQKAYADINIARAQQANDIQSGHGGTFDDYRKAEADRQAAYETHTREVQQQWGVPSYGQPQQPPPQPVTAPPPAQPPAQPQTPPVQPPVPQAAPQAASVPQAAPPAAPPAAARAPGPPTFAIGPQGLIINPPAQ